jgi:hypothetical protein
MWHSRPRLCKTLNPLMIVDRRRRVRRACWFCARWGGGASPAKFMVYTNLKAGLVTNMPSSRLMPTTASVKGKKDILGLVWHRHSCRCLLLRCRFSVRLTSYDLVLLSEAPHLCFELSRSMARSRSILRMFVACMQRQGVRTKQHGENSLNRHRTGSNPVPRHAGRLIIARYGSEARCTR